MAVATIRAGSRCCRTAWHEHYHRGPCPVTDDVAAPVLTNEEVLHEAGRFHLGRDIPWHGYTEHEYKAANPGKPQYPSPFLVDNEPGECRRPHKHQGQRPFGKQAQPRPANIR
jgi:hypothetical protein